MLESVINLNNITNPKHRAILQSLLTKELSVNSISRKLQCTSGAIYYCIKRYLYKGFSENRNKKIQLNKLSFFYGYFLPFKQKWLVYFITLAPFFVIWSIWMRLFNLVFYSLLYRGLELVWIFDARGSSNSRKRIRLFLERIS